MIGFVAGSPEHVKKHGDWKFPGQGWAPKLSLGRTNPRGHSRERRERFDHHLVRLNDNNPDGTGISERGMSTICS